MCITRPKNMNREDEEGKEGLLFSGYFRRLSKIGAVYSLQYVKQKKPTVLQRSSDQIIFYEALNRSINSNQGTNRRNQLLCV